MKDGQHSLCTKPSHATQVFSLILAQSQHDLAISSTAMTLDFVELDTVHGMTSGLGIFGIKWNEIEFRSWGYSEDACWVPKSPPTLPFCSRREDKRGSAYALLEGWEEKAQGILLSKLGLPIAKHLDVTSSILIHSFSWLSPFPKTIYFYDFQ